MNKISRRTLLQGVGAAATLSALGTENALAAPQVVTARKGGATKPRALALIGDAAHNADGLRVSLGRVFKEADIPIDFTTNYYDLSASLLKPYRLFICFRDNRDSMISPGTFGEDGPASAPETSGADSAGRRAGRAAQVAPLTDVERRNGGRGDAWISEDQGKAVKEFVAAGNGFYSYHNNAFVSRSSTNYREVQGGVGLNHPPLRPYKVRIVNKNHPITRGVEDFMVDDEQHYLIYDKDPKNILLHSENIDGLRFTSSIRDPKDMSTEPTKDLGTTSVSGWAHEYGSGRVVFTAMGHTIYTMWQPEHMKLQKNAIRWLLKMN
ncbi:MAG: ThuA domain-containing protein [Granulicella sp.]